jgi:hypothetical protein
VCEDCPNAQECTYENAEGPHDECICQLKFVDNHSDDEILPTKRGVVPFSNSPGTEITMKTPK